jgi:predicted nuclease of restriction endonuclease-like (RecB) superfamily
MTGDRTPHRAQQSAPVQGGRVMAKKKATSALVPAGGEYDGLLARISSLLEQGRRATVRTVNAILAATYWEVGRQIVEYEQGGEARAEYGEAVLKRLGVDLTAKFGRGFSRSNLQQMRLFYLGWEICQTASGKLQARAKCSTLSSEPAAEISPTASAELQPLVRTQLPLDPSASLLDAFPLPWSHYVRLMSVKDDFARWFYEDEAIRGGWSVRQLDRQIGTQFYERTALSRNKETMILKGRQPKPEDEVTLEETVRDPYLLEFLNLKDEYSEGDTEEAITQHLEQFLLELGAGFTFVARQKRIRIGNAWYRMDLVLFHRRLRCLVIIDLKLGEFTHADAGQMNLYLNYAREHLMEPEENEPVGLILCSEKDDAVAHYAMGGIQARVFASRYLTALPSPEVLRQELLKTKHALETRAAAKGKAPE